jgi:hypothetical protein
MAKIAISYRHEDTGWITGRIFDRLKSHYEAPETQSGEESNAVFMDYDSTPLGADFRQFIRNFLDKCDVLLVIIGPRWAGAENGGERRIMRDSDWVRIEIETALKKNIPIIPILIDRAPLPDPDKLPDSIRELAYRQAAIVDSQIDFNSHVDRLLRQLDQLLGLSTRIDVPVATRRTHQQIQRPAPTSEAASLGGQRTRPKSVLAYMAAGIVICAVGALGYLQYFGQATIEPSYESYKSEELGVAITYPTNFLSLDTTQHRQRVLLLRNAYGVALIKITRTVGVSGQDVRIERQKEIDELRKMNFTVTYIAPEKEENWSNWYVLSGVRHGSVFYYRRWYASESVVSMEFDYPKDLALLFNKIIPKMTHEIAIGEIGQAINR